MLQANEPVRQKKSPAGYDRQFFENKLSSEFPEIISQKILSPRYFLNSY